MTEQTSHSSQIRLSQFGNYRDLFLKLKEPAFLVDVDELAILDLNPPAEKFIETILPHQATSIGHKLTEIIKNSAQSETSSSASEFEKHIRIAKRRYHPHEWEWVGSNHKNDLLFINVSACKITLSNQKDVLQIILTDQTKTRIAELKLEQYVEELETMNKKLDELSRVDALTGLTNIRAFKEILELEHSRCSRYGGQYSLVMIDADHFKNYNDKNGHQAGDHLLKQIASIVQKNCRKTDFPARYGGEEFIILCSAVGPDQAFTLSERIRKEIENSVFPHQHLQPFGKITISAGISGYPLHGIQPIELIESADQALYESKHKGRNQSQIFQK